MKLVLIIIRRMSLNEIIGYDKTGENLTDVVSELQNLFEDQPVVDGAFGRTSEEDTSKYMRSSSNKAEEGTS